MSNKRNEARRKNAASASGPIEQGPTNSLLNFAIPTEIVDLPSRGKLYAVGHPLHGKDTIEIRHMTAKEEDILSSQSLLRKGIAIDRMLNNIIMDEGVTVDSLLIGDRNALMYAARITGYGVAYDVKVECEECSKTFDHQFDLSEYSNCYTDADSDIKDHSFDFEFTENGTVEFELPKTGVMIQVRALTGEDETKLGKIREMKEKNKLPDAGLTDAIKMMVYAANGVTERVDINQFIDVVPASDSKYIRDVYKVAMPNVDFKQEAECHHCGHTMEMEVPITGEFFWPE